MKNRRLLPFLLSALLVMCNRDAPTGVVNDDLGGRLTPAATGPNGTFVYVANSASNTVSVIRAADNTVIATIGVGLQPQDIAITPDGAFAYVTNVQSGTVSVIRTADNTVISTVPTGGLPRDVAITPDGAFAYVVENLADNLSVIRTSDNTVVATVPTDLDPDDIADPDGVAITPNGAFAYVANRIGNVSVIRTSDNTVVTSINVGYGTNPLGVAITPDGAFAYVSGNPLSVIRTSDNIVVATIPVGLNSKGVAITPDGAFAYVTGDFLSVIRTSDNSVVTTINGFVRDVAITPGGVFAYVSDGFRQPSVSVIRISDNTVIANVPVGDLPDGVAITHLGVGGPFEPGFWKTNQEAWPGPFEPELPAERVFPHVFPDETLIEVLNLGGGGINALGRQATAALLNSAAVFEMFPITTEDVTETFACAVESGDPSLVEAVKDWFEVLNEGRSGRETPFSPITPEDCPSRNDG